MITKVAAKAAKGTANKIRSAGLAKPLITVAIIGGGIMGVGFVAGGFCPGTSLCAVAIGKIDAIIYVVGIMVGVFIFSEFYTVFQPIYEGYYEGNITLMDSLGFDRYWFVFIFTIIAIIAFVVTNIIRKKLNRKIFY